MEYLKKKRLQYLINEAAIIIGLMADLQCRLQIIINHSNLEHETQRFKLEMSKYSHCINEIYREFEEINEKF